MEARPPAWIFVTGKGDERVAAAWPSAGPVNGASSIFHSVGVLCAQFNRLAYHDHSGPHDGWGGASNWLQVTEGVRADTVADMLAVIRVHLQGSPSRTG